MQGHPSKSAPVAVPQVHHYQLPERYRVEPHYYVAMCSYKVNAQGQRLIDPELTIPYCVTTAFHSTYEVNVDPFPFLVVKQTVSYTTQLNQSTKPKMDVAA